MLHFNIIDFPSFMQLAKETPNVGIENVNTLA